MSNLSEEVLRYFPKKISNLIIDKIENAEEIRIRQSRPLIIKYSTRTEKLDYIVSVEDILECLQRICEYSLYSYQNQIAQGFITVKGGHRVGISGSCVFDNGRVINIKYINSLNFRIARQIYGAANDVLLELIDGNKIFNSIIISPPGFGKTTILKDIVRQLSSGISIMNFNAVNVGVVDERGELAAMFKGVPQNDLGIQVDILENVSKSIGIKMLVRSMGPQIIVADEIGTSEDIEAINYAFCSGVNGIFTAHGYSYADFIQNPIMDEILNLNVIEKLIFLDKEKGKIREVKYLGGL